MAASIQQGEGEMVQINEAELDKVLTRATKALEGVELTEEQLTTVANILTDVAAWCIRETGRVVAEVLKERGESNGG